MSSYFPALDIRPPESPIDQFAKVAQLRSLAGQQQLQQMQIQQAQLEQKSQEAFRQAYIRHQGDIGAIVANPDPDILPKDLMAAQQHDMALQIQRQNRTKDQLDNDIKRNTLISDKASSLLGIEDKQARRAALPGAFADLVKNGVMDSNEAQQAFTLTGHMDDNQLDQWLQIHKYGGMTAKDASQARKNDMEANEAKVRASIAQEKAPFELRKATAEATIKEQEAAAMAGVGGVSGTALPEQEARAWLKNNPGKTLSDYERYKATLVPAFNFNLQQGTPLSSTALDMQAEKYFQTGQLPPIGRGTAGAVQNRKIINRAAELHAGESLAEGSAEYAANKKSLEHLQTLFDSVSAFEGTALKNLDQVAKTGANVPELGAKFLNTPVRAISADVLGTPEMAKFRTALLTAQKESARVLESASASGALTVDASNDAKKILNGDLPFKSMIASINQLKTDFGNRHVSYAQQIADIKGRIGGGAAAPTSTETPAKAFSVPQGAPPPPKEDGHKLKMNGNVIAVSKGGQWVVP